jgi:hypothetical protein
VRLKGRQLQFLLVTLTGWTVLRVATTWPVAVPDLPSIAPSMLESAAFAVVGPVERMRIPVRSMAAAYVPVERGDRKAGQRPLSTPPALPMSIAEAPRPVSIAGDRGMPHAPLSAVSEGGVSAESLRRDAAPSRWGASAYLFARAGGGERTSLAGGGALGGSQAAARITYRLNETGPVKTALAARFYAPLRTRGKEVAVGADWHPLPGRPLRISVERRVGLDGYGRDAWSAYAAGGFYVEPRPHLVLDGYLQGGVVGARSHDLFIDGAVRGGRRIALGEAVLVAGGGVWGAAQPDVERLDAGPRLAVTLPVERHAISLAAEGRFRLAGDARPGSGAALTLSVDF